MLHGTIRFRNMAVVVNDVVDDNTGGGNTGTGRGRDVGVEGGGRTAINDMEGGRESVDHVITPTIIKRRNAFCFNIESNLDRRSSGRRRLIAAITRPRFAMPSARLRCNSYDFRLRTMHVILYSESSPCTRRLRKDPSILY